MQIKSTLKYDFENKISTEINNIIVAIKGKFAFEKNFQGAQCSRKRSFVQKLFTRTLNQMKQPHDGKSAYNFSILISWKLKFDFV